jgi:hypothetical protein
VRRRLRILWKDPRSVLPGALVAFYDLATGTVARLEFLPHAVASEFRAALGALGDVRPGTLLVGDRLYGAVRFFEALSAGGIFGVARRFSAVSIRRGRRLSGGLLEGGRVEDWEVAAGSGLSATPQRLRLIRLARPGRPALELLTNVLDPRRLSAQEALALYRRRWTVERLFSDLKGVLNLRRLYGANVNAVAMQVYASAIVHTALRVAQALAAKAARVEPERISTAKFFPRAAAASAKLLWVQEGFAIGRRLNRGLRLKEPRWHAMGFASTTLREVQVEIRTSRLGRGRRLPGIRTWRTWPKPRQKRPP